MREKYNNFNVHNIRKRAKTIVNPMYDWFYYFQWTSTLNMLLCVCGGTDLTENYKCVNVPRCDREIL